MLYWNKISSYSRPQNGGFGGIWPPKWGAISTKPQKGTSLVEAASFEPSRVKIGRWVWPVEESVKKRYIYISIHLYIYIIKTKLESVSLSCKSHRSKTANIKILFANSKHRSKLHIYTSHWPLVSWHPSTIPLLLALLWRIFLTFFQKFLPSALDKDSAIRLRTISSSSLLIHLISHW